MNCVSSDAVLTQVCKQQFCKLTYIIHCLKSLRKFIARKCIFTGNKLRETCMYQPDWFFARSTDSLTVDHLPSTGGCKKKEKTNHKF